MYICRHVQVCFLQIPTSYNQVMSKRPCNIALDYCLYDICPAEHSPTHAWYPFHYMNIQKIKIYQLSSSAIICNSTIRSSYS